MPAGESVRAKPTRLPRRFTASPVSRERGRSKKNAKSQSMRGRELYKLAFAVFFGWRSPATSPRQLARSAAGDCQFSPTEPVKPTKRAQFGLYLVVHAHTPLRDSMRSTTSTGTESRGHQSTPDHGGVPPCCLPVIRRNVPADAARSHTHMQDLSRDEKQRSNRPISDRLRRWISARNGRPRSDPA